VLDDVYGMSLYELQQRVYENKIRRGFNVDKVSREIVLMAEEIGELCEGVIERNDDEIIDAFGDIMVYGLGLSAMFGFNADEVINDSPEYREKPSDVSGHVLYLARAVGKISRSLKESNKRIVSELDKRDEFKVHIGDLLGYCARALEFVGEDYVSVLEKIVDNNVAREHRGQI
jgi:hypothetical protein